MGRIRKFRVRGLRRRWLINTVGVVCALGLVCVLIITAVFAGYYYSAMQSDMQYRAKTTTRFFADYLNQSYNEYYKSCIAYANSFEDKDKLELQFINSQGKLVVSSYVDWVGQSPTTPDIAEAINSRSIVPYVGSDPQTGERIIAVSSPMIYSNGEVIGVLRYVTSTKVVDMQILRIALISLLALLLVVVIVLVSGSYYNRSILMPLGEIIEKAKMIAGGSYGIQIQAKYDDEMGELAETINELSMRINENEKMQTEFISSLSHELRTPLTAITGWSETLLAGDGLDKDTRRGIKIISSETKRLTEMVVDLLDFTRIQDDRMTLNIEPTDIQSEFEDAVYMYGSRLSQDGIVLEYEESEDLIPEISCDPKRMRQVFLNILDNAAKHGRDGLRIQASLYQEDDQIVVQIRDFGPGIPEDELPLVKRKFYKGSSKSRGTGIGLAVCDEIIHMHGGTLTLENAAGGGALVTVRLPASE